MSDTYEGQDTWIENVRLIRLSDPISGGSSSRINAPVKDLSDRTYWIKERLGQNDIIYADPDESGTISEETVKEYYAPFDMKLEKVNVQVVTQSEQDIVVDVHLNGSTIFVSSDKPTLEAYSNYTETELDTTSTPVSGRDVWQVEKDDKIEIIVDDAGFNGAGLKVIIVGNRDFD